MDPPEPDPRNNRILAALRDDEYERLLPAFSTVRLSPRTALFEPGEPIAAVHFPLSGAVSLQTVMVSGSAVEVASIGNEGIVGLPASPGGSLGVRAVCEMSGTAARVDADHFLATLSRGGRLGVLVRRYGQALFTQVAQGAACNRLHTNEARLSRWLLMNHDRAAGDTFAVTHEAVAQMLGARRPTVTLSASVLQAAGLIRYRRGQVTILDRRGLEGVACECYRAIRSQLDAVVPSGWGRGGGG